MDEEIIIIVTDPPLGPGARAAESEPAIRCYGLVSRRTLRAAKRAIAAKLRELGEPVDEE